ncbi:MAG: RNA recognition motif domain-containing protein [Akkermansiaceae bacterium]
MKLLIRNLDRGITEKEMEKLFLEFGTVHSCDLVMDQASGKSKGFGFVEMPKPAEAKTAIKKLNNTKIGSSNIRVKEADSK